MLKSNLGDFMKQDKRRKVTPELMEKMRKLRKDGLSYAKIADRTGLSLMTVYNYLKKEEKGVIEEEEVKKEEVVKEEEKVGFVQRLKRALGMK
jgi:DNA invertase Pin-like site-specific DNA recombinase